MQLIASPYIYLVLAVVVLFLKALGLYCVCSIVLFFGFFNMATIILCHHCELAISVDCTHCQHTLDRKGVQSPCCARELGAHEYLLVPSPKGRHYCLPCCRMDPDYVVMWQNRFELLQKHKPCSGCAVTLLCAPPRPPLPAVQTDELPIPFPVHSNTTLVRSSLPRQSSC